MTHMLFAIASNATNIIVEKQNTIDQGQAVVFGIVSPPAPARRSRSHIAVGRPSKSTTTTTPAPTSTPNPRVGEDTRNTARATSTDTRKKKRLLIVACSSEVSLASALALYHLELLHREKKRTSIETPVIGDSNWLRAVQIYDNIAREVWFPGVFDALYDPVNFLTNTHSTVPWVTAEPNIAGGKEKPTVDLALRTPFFPARN